MNRYREHDGKPYRQWWSSSRWIKLRDWHKQRQPLCVMCQAQGIITAAEVVDHIRAHKGDEALFYDPDNLQSLCKLHHDSTKQRAEKRGYFDDIGPDGWPIDPRHPSNKAAR